MFRYEFAFRVNDTTITHIELTRKSNTDVHKAYNAAKARLERKGYSVNEMVSIRIKEVQA